MMGDDNDPLIVRFDSKMGCEAEFLTDGEDGLHRSLMLLAERGRLRDGDTLRCRRAESRFALVDPLFIRVML
jgi:hypothetical protein